MKEIFSDLVQNKNFLMFAVTISYVLGLFAYFTDKPLLFAGIFTLASVILILKDVNYKLILVWITVFYIGFFNANIRIKNYDELFKLAPCNAVITGQIVSVPNSNIKNNTKFFLKTDKVIINGQSYDNIKNKTLVGINSFKGNNFSDLKIGNTYEFEGELRRPFTSTNPSQFSYAKYLKNYSTFTTFYADEDKIKLVDKDLPLKWKIVQGLSNKRDEVLLTHSKYLKSPNIDILGGVVFGDDAVAPPDYIKASFIHSGLLHILAASGMNVGFISTFLYYILKVFQVPYKVRLLASIVVVIFYCFMTGLGASVIRAALMLIFVLLGKIIDRDAHSIALLSFVGMLMLLYNPAYINDVGFQLSFIVTFGILVSLDLVIKYTKSVPEWLSFGIIIPVIAQIWVAPIQMFYFNTVSVYSIFANILSMPFLSVLSFGGFASCVFALYSPIADFVCKYSDLILNPCINAIVYISDFFAKLPHSLYYTTHPSILQILIYYLIIGGIIYFIKTDFKNKKLAICTIVLTAVLVLSNVVHIPNRNFEVITFDVGNADSFLLRTPQNKYFIVDTGKMGYNGRRSQADIILLKYLRDRGIKSIEGLIVTHFDADHAGGTVDIVDNVKVKNVYVNSVNEDKRLAKKIYTTVKNKPFTNLVLAQNNTLIYKEPNFSMTTLRANIPQHGHDSEANENSIILLVNHGENSLLFTGDAGVRAFNQLKNNLPKNITVLKVGHHGARNVINKEMVDFLNPQISIVSVGYNRYGHPDPLTIKLLSNTRLLRTDKSHAIKFVSSSKDWKVYGYDSNDYRFHKIYGCK